MNEHSANMDSTRATPDVRSVNPPAGAHGGAIQMNQFAPGDVIESRYQILSVLGQGGFGCVYKANQILLNKLCALKTLNPINVTELTKLRLHKEAQAAGRLEHRNLVRALDFGLINGVQPFLVMDYVQGPTLAEYLKAEGKLSVASTLEIFIPLAQALAYAHGQGVVHRDLKPSNVILDTSGTGPFVPKIVDFGIAKIQFPDDSHQMTLTSTGEVFGTPIYMSPEQCAGTAVDMRSDIYSLGCMLFEALTGAPPFNGRNPLEVMMQHSNAPVPSLKEASMGDTFPKQLERIVVSMLAKNPDERYTKCQRLADDLSWLQNGEFDRISTIAQTGAVLPRVVETKNSWPVLVSIAAISLVVGGCVGYPLGLFRPVSANLKPEQMVETKDLLGVLNMPEYTYYSQPIDGKKSFKFGWDNSSGLLYWWHQGRLNHVQARKVQTVPKDAKLIFVPAGPFFRQPDLWARFHQNELYGVSVTSPPFLSTPESMNQAIRLIAQQDDLAILLIEKKEISLRTFRAIGDIPRLMWFGFCDNKVDGQVVSGQQFADWKRVQDLHVLKVAAMSSPSVLLTKLASGSAMRRLSLSSTGLTDGDIKLISKLKSLEVLSLLTFIPTGDVVEDIAKIKHLKGLVVEPKLLEAATPESLQKLHGLKIFVARSTDIPASPEWQKVLDNLHGCELIQDNKRSLANDEWFNPLTEDPGKSDI